MSVPYIALQNVTKIFGEFRANDAISLEINKGEIYGLLGENGAGKTTLMNILYGLYRPDAGSTVIDGCEVEIDSPRAAQKQGIGMIHQHFTLVETLSVTENIVLGLKGGGPFLALKKHSRRVAELSDRFGFEIEPGVLVRKLPVGMQQRVEIMKLLYRNAEILILDEPTSVLAPGEIKSFFAVLRELCRAGKTIIIITHKLEEVVEIADRVAIMRNGRIIAKREVSNTDARELASLMVGRDVLLEVKRERRRVGQLVLQIKNLGSRNDRGLPALEDFSLDVHSGEIVGLAGVDGNGQTELAETLAGLRRSEEGNIFVKGRDISSLTVAERKHKIGLGYVPAERRTVGLVESRDVAFNLLLRNYDRPPL